MLRLTRGDAEALLQPGIGGAIAAYRVAGNDILRPAPAGASDALAMACFPLVPYANRIAGGRFTFAGRVHELPRNFGDHPHSLHGLGWQRLWDVIAATSDRALLRHEHDGGAGWPWAYRAEQEISLDRSALRIGLSVTNHSDRTMPAGLGLHPYFPSTSTTRLRFSATRCWEADETCLPTHSALADRFGNWIAGTGVQGGTLIDNSYEGWDGNATIQQAGTLVTLRSTGAAWLHLYRPPNEAFFCAEPVTHMPDVLNRAQRTTVLAPGETMRMDLAIEVTEADRQP